MELLMKNGTKKMQQFPRIDRPHNVNKTLVIDNCYNTIFMTSISYTEARDRLATVWDETIATRKPVVISRRGSESVVLVALDEWNGLLESAHLLRSPANAKRLLGALP